MIRSHKTPCGESTCLQFLCVAERSNGRTIQLTLTEGDPMLCHVCTPSSEEKKLVERVLASAKEARYAYYSCTPKKEQQRRLGIAMTDLADVLEKLWSHRRKS